jgi:sterol desaturase/sphingolipid hydroxylase (fatty acid hydroxylase superfamily)
VSIIQASIPLFFALIGLELAYQWMRGRQLQRLNDSITDLSLGTLSQLSGVFTKVLTIGIYVVVAERFAIQQWIPAVPAWPEGAPLVREGGFPGLTVQWGALWSWTVTFVLVDVAYYWSHRLSHEVHILWAGHVVHHSSEEYNLAVALRQSSLHGLMTWVFYVPLALIGIPWRMFVACHALNLIYQFWIHTRAVGRLGAFTEAVFNTPSHHRVHHGVNPKYQDKNYAGVFITWDKWFGTFVPEEEEPVYGLTHPLGSWNPLWANVHVFVEIWRLVRATPAWRDKWRVVFGAPAWRPEALGGSVILPEVTADTFRKFDPPVSAGVTWYATAQFTSVLAAAVPVLAIAGDLPTAQAAALAFYIALSLANVGALLEGEAWGAILEYARLLSLGVASATLLVTGGVAPILAGGALLWFGGSALWLRAVRPPVSPPDATATRA